MARPVVFPFATIAGLSGFRLSGAMVTPREKLAMEFREQFRPGFAVVLRCKNGARELLGAMSRLQPQLPPLSIHPEDAGRLIIINDRPGHSQPARF